MFSGPANSDAIGFSVGDQNGQQLTVKDTKDPIKINIKIPLEEMQVTRIPCSGNRLVNLTKVDNLVMVTDKGCDFTIEDDGGFYTAEQYTASEKERKQLNLIGDVNMLVLKSEGTEDRQLNISFSSGQLYSSNSGMSYKLIQYKNSSNIKTEALCINIFFMQKVYPGIEHRTECFLENSVISRLTQSYLA